MNQGDRRERWAGIKMAVHAPGSHERLLCGQAGTRCYSSMCSLSLAVGDQLEAIAPEANW